MMFDLVAPIGYYTPVPACATANVIASARAALAAAPRGTVPTIALRVTRDARLFGPEHKRFVGSWDRGGLEVYRHEQLRFAFVGTTVSERLDVAVIDEGTGLFRLELASEQHLWIKHSNWTHDPVPTIVADLDEDGELVAREPYTVETLA